MGSGNVMTLIQLLGTDVMSIAELSTDMSAQEAAQPFMTLVLSGVEMEEILEYMNVTITTQLTETDVLQPVQQKQGSRVKEETGSNTIFVKKSVEMDLILSSLSVMTGILTLEMAVMMNVQLSWAGTAQTVLLQMLIPVGTSLLQLTITRSRQTIVF